MSTCDFTDPKCRPFDLKGTNGRGVLVIHGFTGSPAHVRLAADYLNAAGYTVKGILLPGHCTSLDDLSTVKYGQWLECAQKGYDELVKECGRVSVIGLSMGGLIALWLAEHNSVQCCVTYSAPVGVKNPLAPFAKSLRHVLPKTLDWGAPKGRGEGFQVDYDFGYTGIAVSAVIEFNTLNKLVINDLGKITAPLLACQSDADTTIKRQSMQLILDGVKSTHKEKLRLARSSHVICLGPERKLLFQRTLDWINNSYEL